ncbi:hypothetical protein, partial [Streptomyces sp. GbtcB7]|uniref:hypothetical protein n=1 Tax=Streptomyces sp. GbtcB7 TaxID=2824752 RepID=UPI001C2F4E8C
MIHPEVVALSDRLGLVATGDVVERIAASIRRYSHPSISPTLRIVRSPTADDGARRAAGVIVPPAS